MRLQCNSNEFLRNIWQHDMAPGQRITKYSTQYTNQKNELLLRHLSAFQLAKILPTEDTFLAIFRSDNRYLSGKIFMEASDNFSKKVSTKIEPLIQKMFQKQDK